MKDVILIEGGIGKQIAMTGVLREYAKKSDDGIIVLSPHDYVFWGIPGIEVYNLVQKKLYENVIKPNNFIHLEPYHIAATYRDNQSIIKTAAEQLHMEYTEQMMPKVFLNTFEKNEAEEFALRKENLNGYIIFQPFGATGGPHGDHTSRSMEVSFATKLAEELTKKYRVYQVSSPHVSQLPNCMIFSPDTTPRQIMAVATKAKYIVTIDSFMNHVAPAIGKQAIVVWGSTSEKVFGYDSNINIREFECPNFIPTRLYINDPDIDQRNSYANKFTDKTLNAILEQIM